MQQNIASFVRRHDLKPDCNFQQYEFFTNPELNRAVTAKRLESDHPKPLRTKTAIIFRTHYPKRLEVPMPKISDPFLELARCPITKSRLTIADEKLLKQITDAIETKRLHNRDGELIVGRVDSCLVNQEHSVVYLVRNGIVVLTTDRAIEFSGELS